MSNAEIKISLSNHPIVRTPRISGGIFFVYISIDDLGSWNYQGLVILTEYLLLLPSGIVAYTSRCFKFLFDLKFLLLSAENFVILISVYSMYQWLIPSVTATGGEHSHWHSLYSYMAVLSMRPVTRCRKNSHSYFIKIGSTMGSGTAKKSISIVQKVFFPYLDCIYHQSVGCSCGSPTGYQGKHLTVIIIFNVFLFYVGVLVSLIQCFQ